MSARVPFTLLSLAFVVAVFGLVFVGCSLRGDDPAVEYIVLVKTDAPTPSETVTAWNAYEAAPQLARSPAEAIASFRHDSGLAGPMLAVPLADWRP